MKSLSHLDRDGKATMVDVSAKNDTERSASAEATVHLSEEAFSLVTAGEAPKGDVLATARLAGIMAAKKTSDLIPLCHPLALSHVGVEFTALEGEHAFHIVASAKTKGPTGVEMEALTAVSVAALTIYDMVKAVDRSARIEGIRVIAKSGGKSGTFEAREPAKTSPAQRVAAPSPAPASRKIRATPSELMNEVASPRAVPAGVNAAKEREALRSFMTQQRLKATDWAKLAKVPVGELYGFLGGRSRALSEDSAEKLARAARSSVAAMLGRTR
jgi:cyclic pyranopterin phosphate synthase